MKKKKSLFRARPPVSLTRYIRNRPTFKTALKYNLLNGLMDGTVAHVNWTVNRFLKVSPYFWKLVSFCAVQPPLTRCCNVTVFLLSGGRTWCTPRLVPSQWAPPAPPAPSHQHTAATNYWILIISTSELRFTFIWALGRKHRHLPIYLVALHISSPPPWTNSWFPFVIICYNVSRTTIFSLSFYIVN